MKENVLKYSLLALALILTIVNLTLIKVRWENTILISNIDKKIIERSKLNELNLKLKTEKHFLESPARNERSARSELEMIKAHPLIIIDE